jgi:hypothetical protein
MRSWKDYNVLRESTPVEDRDRMARELSSIEMKNNPDYARADLRDRSYSRNEEKYKNSIRKIVNVVRSCMKNLGMSEVVVADMRYEGDLYNHCAMQDPLDSKTSLFVDVSLYFKNILSDDTVGEIPPQKEFTRKVAQGKEIYLDVDTSSNLSFFTEDSDLQAEFNETFKDVLKTGFSNEFSKKQINFMLKLISHCQDGTENPCRALKSAINSGLITLSCDTNHYENRIHIYYTFPVSVMTSDREKSILTQAMTDIVDFTNTFNGEENEIEEDEEE